MFVNSSAPESELPANSFVSCSLAIRAVQLEEVVDIHFNEDIR